jgi:vitamin B12 transporter
VVRASRTPQPINQLGSAVSVIDRQQIERRKAPFVSDFLRDMPGIAVSRAGSFGNQTQVRVRGGEANHVLVMIDGVEVNDPAASDEFSFEQLTSWDVERIEVVRGPQSALWGSDAMAGVINITTRQTKTERSIGGFGEVGSFGTSNYGGHLGGDFGRGSVDFSASRYDTDGENISRTGGEEDGYENITASLRGSFAATEDLNLSLIGRYSDGTSQFDAIDGATSLPTDAPLESDVELFLLRATGDLALANQRWLNRAQFTYSSSDRDNKDGRAVGDPLIDDPVDFEGYRYGFEYQTSYDFSADPETNRLILAVEHERDEYQQSGPVTFDDPNQKQEIDNTGLVAEYLIQPWSTVNLSASLRHDDNSDFDDETTWRLSGTWRFDDTGTRLRASAGKGQKSPTFTERFGFFSGSFIGNPDLKPEESIGYEFGVSQEAAQGRVQANLTYFQYKVEDEINGFVFDPGTGSFTAENADGNSRRRGVEFDVSAQLAGGFDAQASYTYTDSKEPDAANGGKRREIRRPRHMAAMNLNYEFLNERARLNLNVSYTGKQKDDFFAPTFVVERVQLDEYTLVDLVASYDVTEAFSVYARAENLFDKDYENIFGFQSPGDGYYAGVRMRLR